MAKTLLGFILGIFAGVSFFAPRREPIQLSETIVVGRRPGPEVAVGFCEGTYNCTTGGRLFPVGSRTTIGFWNVNTCPGSTSLGDGSGWTLVPLTCNCP